MTTGAPRRTLVLMRHAKSDWSRPVEDLSRPIGKRGRRQAAQAGRWLALHLGAIDLAVVSPALRARSTWEVASAELAVGPGRSLDDRVYTAAVEDLLAVVRDLPANVATALLVGHDPALSDLAGLLAGCELDLVTSSLTVLRFDGAWDEITGSSITVAATGRPPGPLPA